MLGQNMKTSCFGLGLLFVLVAHSFADDPVDFNRDIRTLLSDRCFACHGPDENVRKAELRLDLENEAFAGEAPIIVRGDAAASELYQRITSDDPELRMPPLSSNKSLSQEEQELLGRWIDEGAKWSTHWAYIKPQKEALPAGESDNPVDRFVRTQLQSKGLVASAEADRVTLIRRLYFDLIGLPPTPEQVAAFVKDSSPQAYDTVVESLLQSQYFGERLAIYWLDVVRFADSNGYHSDEARQIAPYRDYVIDAFNTNMPYDRFVIEQLAGDLLPDATLRQHVASGFNMLLQTTSEGGAQAKEYEAKYAADRVRNTAQIFLGSTLGCAECHNHKFDPFTQKDFYSFAAFFADIQQPAVGNPATFPVMTDDHQQAISGFDERLSGLRKVTETTTPELEAAQIVWAAALQEKASSSAKLEAWYTIGPFRGESFDAVHATSFLDPTKVDLNASVGDLDWKKADHYVDGVLHNLDPVVNSARYFVRTIHVSENAELPVALGSDDSVTLWLNGQQVHDNKVSRGAQPNQDQVKLALKAGPNQLLMRICNGGGAHGFIFTPNVLGLPENVTDILRIAVEERNGQQKEQLAVYYRSIAPALQPVRDELVKLAAEKQTYVDAIPKTMMTKVGDPRVIRLLKRGNWLDDSGPVMLPAIPEFLGNLDLGDRRGNRLDLAHWIVDPENPLTARTLVNRLWKLYFGHGLATPLDDFGRQGTLPTHPELLDWLAVELIESGWDLKHTIRLLVTSQTYRQTSLISERLKEVDPYNKLYARQTRFRLDAEIVRDNALALSGILVHRLGGRSVYPYQPAGYWSHMNFPTRTWPTDNGDNLYRRGVYTWWQRMFLHPAMVAFDAPSREECTVERPRSNIPQQALVLLNDPTYVEAARVFAERIMNEGGKSPAERIEWAWRQVLSRAPTAEELQVLVGVFEKHLAEYEADAAAAKAFVSVGNRPLAESINLVELAGWTSVARVLFNLHETITRS